MKNFLNEFVHSWWLPWLIIGVVLRLLLAAISVHPHAHDLNFSAYLFSYNGIFNIYDYLANLPDNNPFVNLYGRGVFTYPPLAYFTLGLLMLITKPLFDPSFMNFFVNNPLSNILGQPELFGHLLLLKLPYLFFDLSIAFLLMRLFNQKGEKKKALLLWLFNPVSLYTSFIVSQFDVIPVFFVVLGLLFAFKGRKEMALVSLSLGGGYKLFPLLLVPIFVLILGKTNLERIKLLAWGIVPYILTILPFLPSPAFRQNVLLSNQSQKMLFMGLPVSGAEVLYIFVVLLIVLWFWLYYHRVGTEKIWIYVLITFLLYFSVTHYHPQWFLWVTPFLVLELVFNNFKRLFLVGLLVLSWLTLTLFFEPSLSYGAFSPLWPQLEKAAGLSDVVSKYIDPFLIKSIFRSVFAGAALVLTVDLLREKIKA